MDEGRDGEDWGGQEEEGVRVQDPCAAHLMGRKPRLVTHSSPQTPPGGNTAFSTRNWVPAHSSMDLSPHLAPSSQPAPSTYFMGLNRACP